MRYVRYIDPQVIAGEVADLLAGDIPFFAVTPRHRRPGHPAYPAGTPAGTGRYDYRVWTFKARRLWFIV